MAYVAGIDGCRRAWIAVSREVGNPQLNWTKYSALSEILSEARDIEVIGIDIPIGLPETGPRECDVLARRLLGRARGSSVFPAPIRAVLGAEDYQQACAIRHKIEGKKMSKQAWGIVPKIREVDRLLQESPQLRTVIYEVHPEVSFCLMGNGEPNVYSKKTEFGIRERIEKLLPYFNIDTGYVQAKRVEHRASEDDIVDALAALWSAERIFHHKNRILPAEGNAKGPRIYA